MALSGDSISSILKHGEPPQVARLPADAIDNLPIKLLQSDLMGGLYIKSNNPAYDKDPPDPKQQTRRHTHHRQMDGEKNLTLNDINLYQLHMSK